MHSFRLLLLQLAAALLASPSAMLTAAFSATPAPAKQTKSPTQTTKNGNGDGSRLKEYQKQGIPIASSFIPETYRPHPLFTNKHFQTVIGVFIRDSPGCAYIEQSNIINEAIPVAKAVVDAVPTILGIGKGEGQCDYWDTRERFDTPDGDFFDVDYKFSVGGGKATVMIIHGLESNSNSSMCINMARSYIDRGMDVACVNFRGCSGEPNNTPLQYHAGFTDDLIVFLDKWSERRSNDNPLYVTGFSLGANVAMKLLGDLGIDAVDKYNIRGAAVSGAPFDLNFHWRRLIDDDFNRIIYAGTLMKSMKKKAKALIDTFGDGDENTIIDYSGVMNANNIPEIEDAMIAPLYGFEDKFDYYDKSAALPVVDLIAVPTFVLNAEDDPFFDPISFPFEKDCKDRNDVAPVRLVRTEKGGHLGHLFHCVDSPTDKSVASFAPMELARFLDHVHNSFH